MIINIWVHRFRESIPIIDLNICLLLLKLVFISLKFVPQRKCIQRFKNVKTWEMSEFYNKILYSVFKTLLLEPMLIICELFWALKRSFIFLRLICLLQETRIICSKFCVLTLLVSKCMLLGLFFVDYYIH